MPGRLVIFNISTIINKSYRSISLKCIVWISKGWLIFLLCYLSKNYSKHINRPNTMKLTEHSEVEVPLGTRPTAGLHRTICAFSLFGSYFSKLKSFIYFEMKLKERGWEISMKYGEERNLEQSKTRGSVFKEVIITPPFSLSLLKLTCYENQSQEQRLSLRDCVAMPHNNKQSQAGETANYILSHALV